MDGVHVGLKPSKLFFIFCCLCPSMLFCFDVREQFFLDTGVCKTAVCWWLTCIDWVNSTVPSVSCIAKHNIFSGLRLSLSLYNMHIIKTAMCLTPVLVCNTAERPQRWPRSSSKHGNKDDWRKTSLMTTLQLVMMANRSLTVICSPLIMI